MNASQELAARLREVLLSGKWIAYTNYKDQIQGISLQQATQKVGSLNTIAALTFHVNYYLEGIIQVFEGGDLVIRDKFSFDLPEMHTEDEWNLLVANFVKNAEVFAAHVETFSEDKLDSNFVKEAYGNYRRNIEGVIEHAYYHLGQLVIINKLISERRQ